MAAAVFVPQALLAATFAVTTAADSGPGSLRQAILDANASPGPDNVVFAIPGGGIVTISPLTALPVLADAAVIDGSTQPGFAGSPVIELDGSQVGIGIVGLEDSGGGSTIRALAIGGFGSYGILLDGPSGSAVEGCYVGLDASGTMVRGNRIAGIGVTSGAHRIGGTAPGAGNVIAGQTIGIDLSSPQQGNVIQGNVIGLLANGIASGSSLGINLASPGTLVGGAAPGAGNVVSGHQGDGINLSAEASGSVIQGNRIGTDVTGEYAISNTAIGVSIAGADNVLVGGAAPGAGNLISGNGGNAVTLLGNGGVVQGNLLGVNATATGPIPNGQGVHLAQAFGATIGGLGSGEGNVIADNLGSGVVVDSGDGNSIRGNAIFGNGAMGIDLVTDDLLLGPTANDEGDYDEGANHLQNFPIIEQVDAQPGALRIRGYLSSAADSVYTIDFYSDSACAARPRTPPQARTHLGEATVTTSGGDAPDHGGGEVAFDVTLDAVLEPGDVVTATATDAGGDTSEVSSGIVFGVAPRSGSFAGGEAIAVLGTDFPSDATVTVGGIVVSSLVVTETTIAAVSPALPPGIVVPVTVSSPGGPVGSLSHAWLSDFLDVAPDDPFHHAVVALVGNGVSAGCGGGLYCVDTPMTRAQAAPFLLRARNGACVAPPPCTGAFVDVPCPGPFTDWIEALAVSGITAGCGDGGYCPTEPVRRDQASVLLLKAALGSAYRPPPCSGMFEDVPCPGPFADWIEDLAERGIASGCGNGDYCPAAAVTRGQMAALITGTFPLP